MKSADKKPPKRISMPLSVDAELAARIEAARKRRHHANPNRSQVMKEMMRLGLDVDEGKIKLKVVE